MMSPCKDCPKRVCGCHSTCPDYKEYQDKNNEHRKERMMSTVLADHSPSQSSRIKKNTMERLRRGVR